MLSRDTRDMLGGLVLTGVGAWVAWYAAAHYELGQMRRMGPGMFPMGSGVLLALFGLGVALPAFFRTGPRPRGNLAGAFWITLAVAAFAVIMPRLGLFPAIVATVALSSLAGRSARPGAVLALSAALCVTCWLVFRVGLGMRLPLVHLPGLAF